MCDATWAVDLSRPPSHPLTVPHSADLLGRAKRGVGAYYRLHTAGLGELGELIGSVDR